LPSQASWLLQQHNLTPKKKGRFRVVTPRVV
jgi:hypothetical protein